MERITVYDGSAGKGRAGKTMPLYMRLEEYDLSLEIETGIRIAREDFALLSNSGEWLPGVELTPERASILEEIRETSTAMVKAYTVMQVKGMDMNGRVLENEVSNILSGVMPVPENAGAETLVARYTRYVEEQDRDGVYSKSRYRELCSFVKKLERFLKIKGRSRMTLKEFTVDVLLEYRRFCYDEYQYVKDPKYADLYPKQWPYRWPKERLTDSSVVQVLRALRAFFFDMENTDEIAKSPFKKLTREKQAKIMMVRYDSPFYLRAEEFQRVLELEVENERMKLYKNFFIMLCCTGCRVSDLLSLSMENVSVSEEGIPYIHYLPKKTRNRQMNFRETKTPLIRPAFDIIKAGTFWFGGPRDESKVQRINYNLPKLLKMAGIDRKVAVYNHVKGENEYKPLWELATSRLGRKTHIDMMAKVQVNIYAAGLHSIGADSVERYTHMEIQDRFTLMNVAFGQKDFRVDKDLNIVEEKSKKVSMKAAAAIKGEESVPQVKPYFERLAWYVKK